MQLKENNYIPSLDQLDERLFYPQNLPSIVCARVLEPTENQNIMDMCACPGGKTLHIASLVNNKVSCLPKIQLLVDFISFTSFFKSRIVAFDKISSKVEQMKSLCDKMDATCIECSVQDSTKIGKPSPNLLGLGAIKIEF